MIFEHSVPWISKCEMTTAILNSLILSTFLTVSTQFNNDGISGYCEKSRLYPYWYVPTPVECCDDRGKCDKYIGPGQTKYGLTNPDQKWPRRLCSCDQKLYECVMNNLSPDWINWARDYGFSQETCFLFEWYMKYNESITLRGPYTFIPLLSVLPPLEISSEVYGFDDLPF